MTTIKLDDYLSLILPWDLQIEIDGLLWATHAPTIGDLAVLESAEAAARRTPGPGGRAASPGLAGILAVVRGLFNDGGVPLDDKPLEAIGAIISIIMAHWNGLQKKTTTLAQPTGRPVRPEPPTA